MCSNILTSSNMYSNQIDTHVGYSASSYFSWTPPEQEHGTQEPTYHLPPTRVVVIVGVVKVALVIVAVMIVVVMVVIVVIFVW